MGRDRIGDTRRVFPAPAGMNRGYLLIGPQFESVPRARGDEPHARVWVDSDHHVFPAPAGMNRIALLLLAIWLTRIFHQKERQNLFNPL